MKESKERSEAEKLAEDQARKIWDSWIIDSTEIQTEYESEED